MGIGSKLKKAIRKVIPNELSEIAVKAAPIVAPFNPAIAAAMAGIGSFDQTGRIGSSLKSAGGTYLGGQAVRGIAGAGPKWGFGGTPEGGIGSYFTSPFTGEAAFGPERGSFFRGEGSILGDLPPDEVPSSLDVATGTTEELANMSTVDPRADASGRLDTYRSAYKPEGIAGSIQPTERVGYTGTTDRITNDPDLYYGDTAKRYEKGHFYSPERVALEGPYDNEITRIVHAQPTPIGTEATELAAREQMIPQGVPGDSFSGSEYNLFSPEGKIDPVKRDVLMAERQTMSYEQNEKVDVKGKEISKENPKLSERWATTKKNWVEAEGAGEKLGVVMDFLTDPANSLIVSALKGSIAAIWTYIDNKANEDVASFTSFEDMPTNMYNLEYKNAKDGGIIGLANGGEPTMEMDYRGGGFIPVGARERADDVPARLSKNEFVMTADAVRAAGGGSVDVGAQRMYNLMNQLEGVA
jgi:hypothetical protein